MYPSVTQFETRRSQVEQWIAAREASRDARESAAPSRPRPGRRPNWTGRLVNRMSTPSEPASSLGRLPRRERLALRRLSSAIEVPAGRPILLQGKHPDSFFVIEHGRAAVHRNAKHVADLGPGDFFGEIALIERRQRTASVVATTDLVVRVVSELDFATAIRTLPTFARVLRDAKRARLAPASA